MNEPTRIWLCDLTYTQQTIASDVMPAAVGCIAAYALDNMKRKPSLRIFKLPEKLASALETEAPPEIIGFSNYIWNHDLSAQFARLIKSRLPRVVTVMGGPNYPTTVAEREAFLRRHPMIDFYIEGEGERAFTGLVEALKNCQFDVEHVPDDLPSIHRINANGEFLAAQPIERIRNLSEVPSPYLTGLMDEFFDGVMLPIIQTNRGCPFRCTFCVEGAGYYSRVSKHTDRKTHAELEYISSRMARLRDEAQGRTDLFIADSNFAMYKEDLTVCRSIAEMQAKYGYPEYINVATGKNQKERVLEAARLIGGALRVSGSVQSLDEQVLKNIERKNIDADGLMDLALSASEIGANSYCEIILGLPGDSRDAHLKTIRTVVEADFNRVLLFQLMLLPGTDLASAESINRWKMQTRYRVLPRCFGHYECLGEEINAAEIEEICVANDSLTLADYLDCRHMHMIVNVFYNDGVFKELLRLIKLLGLSKYAWLERLWLFRDNGRFDDLVRMFLKETQEELWSNDGELEHFARRSDTIERYISGELGANLIFKYKSLTMIDYVDDLARIASATFTDMLKDADLGGDALALGNELIEFARLRMSGLFTDLESVHTGIFHYEVERFAETVAPRDLAGFRLPAPRQCRLRLNDQQKQTIRNYLSIYGSDPIGVGRILSKVYVRQLFRVPEVGARLSEKELTEGRSTLTGLNQFG